ncbi:hypothetical protein Q4574_02120 [Aliiglaciecola sp. 3_MG-2023]|uniref:hypothetical protein n=1 Tax=Aliiglaciecola sp. 3_MG-2023 TaxID=3062644 RepID=UPI0026E1ED65|nr:hypothetical protein [Aliiglaciecola sp. 3_MG-2023]MDO6692057.1 hypothetical protein [Aliiglaciecola sp. 3_MG-2023]
MNRKLKVFSSLGAVMFSMVFVLQTQLSGADDFCQNIDTLEFNPNLPITHPINRCASVNHNNVSWKNWFSGRSGYKFHYLDLLELLFRAADTNSPVSSDAQ